MLRHQNYLYSQSEINETGAHDRMCDAQIDVAKWPRRQRYNSKYMQPNIRDIVQQPGGQKLVCQEKECQNQDVAVYGYCFFESN